MATPKTRDRATICPSAVRWPVKLTVVGAGVAGGVGKLGGLPPQAMAKGIHGASITTPSRDPQLIGGLSMNLYSRSTVWSDTCDGRWRS
jgi:hypothetical protein